jgi:hypothetical protein
MSFSISHSYQNIIIIHLRERERERERDLDLWDCWSVLLLWTWKAGGGRLVSGVQDSGWLLSCEHWPSSGSKSS